jgi:predicted transposase YbfD/YdcC
LIEIRKTAYEESLKMKHTTEATITTSPENEMVFDVGSLMSHLAGLTDPRKAKGVRYQLKHLLTFLILAKLGGEDGMKGMAEWVRLRGQALVRLLNLPRESLPHQTTYERVVECLDVVSFDELIGKFFAQKDNHNLTINLDGKVLRGTIPEGETQGVHLLAAYVPEQGVVLMQVEVAGHSNEITAAPRLLEAIDLRDCVVTGDAMFTQTDLCVQIVEAGGDYVFPVKGNQAKLQQAIADVFMPFAAAPGRSSVRLPEDYTETVSSGHGRIEQRYLTVSTQLNDYLDWPHVKQVFRLQRVVQRLKTGKITYQVVFGVTSLSPEDCPPHRLLHLLRSHWHIENRLHYVRDVSFSEDACQVRSKRRQRFLASLNNLVIGLIRSQDFDYIPEARRFFSLNYHQALQLLL